MELRRRGAPNPQYQHLNELTPSVSALFFDLDGTISDPLPGIRGAVAFALEQLNLPPVAESHIAAMIGPPLESGLHTVAGIPKNSIQRAITLYREYYFDRGWRENNLYPAIPEVLNKLSDSGHTLAVATFKPEAISKKILNHFGIAGKFIRISGAERSSDGTKKGILEYLLEELNLPPDRCLMIGDRDKDRDGAMMLSIPFLAAGWGYAAEGEFPQDTKILSTPGELLNLL